MPELPEVESIVRGLRPMLVGQRIVTAELAWPRAVATPAPECFVAGVAGRTVTAVGRRAKYVLIALDGPCLLVHLRMTGQLLMCPVPDAKQMQDSYVRVVFHLDSGAALLFRDVRKFGRLWLVDDPATVVGNLGPEPLAHEFTPDVLHSLLQRGRQLKPLLTDQRVIAGLGNIYVDEALWEARLHPLRRADTLSDDEIDRLHAAIRVVLARAIAHGGTTLRDYRTPSGELGQYQSALAVYGRAGKPCPRCGGPVKRIVVAQRGTHFCPCCQHQA